MLLLEGMTVACLPRKIILRGYQLILFSILFTTIKTDNPWDNTWIFKNPYALLFFMSIPLCQVKI